MSERDVTSKVNMPNGRFIAVIVVIVVVLLVAVNSIYIVDPQEEAVVLNFGKYHTTSYSGAHIKIPFIQKVYKVNTKEIKTMTFGFTQQSGLDTTYQTDANESLLLTGDSNILDIRWSIQYRVTNAKEWLFNVDSNYVRDDRGQRIDNREKTIRDISLAVINKAIGNSSLNRIFEGDRTKLNIDSLAEMNERLSNIGLGVTISKVQFETVAAPSGAVQEAFNDVTAATVEKNRYIDEGNVYRSQQLPKVRGEAQRTKELADGYAIERVNLANGDVAKFRSMYEEYQRNPEITKQRLYFEMMETITENSENIELIDKDLTNFIPFKDLTEQGGN